MYIMESHFLYIIIMGNRFCKHTYFNLSSTSSKSLLGAKSDKLCEVLTLNYIYSVLERFMYLVLDVLSAEM